jgi:hypothetical protein
MPYRDLGVRRASGRERSKRYRKARRPPTVTPEPAAPLPALGLRSPGEILSALEFAITLAQREPYVAQIVISAARAASSVLQAHVLEGRLAAVESLIKDQRAIR